MSEQNYEYADVTMMFRHLATLDPGSIQCQRQREAIIQRCLPLADHIARRFRNRGEPLDDLVQVARVGLMNAVNRYNVDNGEDLNSQLKRAREELSHQLGRAPTAGEIAAELGIDREEVVQGQIASSAYATLSSDAPIGGADSDDGRSVINTIGDLDANLDKVLDVATVRPLLNALPEREQTVLQLRFFENMTQSQIAARLGISQMHVSRLLARSLDRLRQQVRAPELV
jgi:RNA polymerase sigma-B factor